MLENWDSCRPTIEPFSILEQVCRLALLLVMRGASSRGFRVYHGSRIQMLPLATVTEVMLLKNGIRAITGVASTSVLHRSK
jgi:hypothetical protein